MNAVTTQSIAVIIPARNEERYIAAAIRSVRACSYPQDKVEIILVDNGSSDQTVSEARNAGATVLELPGCSLGKLRNAGAAHSEASILAFLDADCTVAIDWLTVGIESLALDRCITGSRVEVPNDAGWLEQAWFTGLSAGRKEAAHINTANLFVTREDFNALGGFNETLRTGEDTEFSERAKKMLKVIDDARIRVIHHGNPKTLYAFFRRELWHGLGAFGTFQHNKFDKPLLGTFAFVGASLLQALGLLILMLGYSAELWLAGSLGILLLLSATVWYRRESIQHGAHILQLMLLYYLYYLARSISLLFLLLRRPFYHSIKD